MMAERRSLWLLYNRGACFNTCRAANAQARLSSLIDIRTIGIGIDIVCSWESSVYGVNIGGDNWLGATGNI